MPSKDCVPAKLTKKTVEEIHAIRTKVAREQGIDWNKVSQKQAEIIFRLKSTRGFVSKEEVRDVLMGKIK